MARKCKKCGQDMILYDETPLLTAWVCVCQIEGAEPMTLGEYCDMVERKVIVIPKGGFLRRLWTWLTSRF